MSFYSSLHFFRPLKSLALTILKIFRTSSTMMPILSTVWVIAQPPACMQLGTKKHKVPHKESHVVTSNFVFSICRTVSSSAMRRLDSKDSILPTDPVPNIFSVIWHNASTTSAKTSSALSATCNIGFA